MLLTIIIEIHILQCFHCIPFYAIGRREGSLILSTKSQVSSHSFGPSSSSWSLRRQSSRLFWMLSWFRSFPMNTNSWRRSPQGHAWSLIGAYPDNNVYIRKSTSPFSWDNAFRISGSLGDPCQRCLCRKRIEDLWKSEGSSYLNSQSHGLYGLILMILPACWKKTWIVWLLASISI